MAAPAKLRQAPQDKFEARRRELARAALQTLGQLGYARTGLREIALNSPYSHGVVHYYFADKSELITYCVRLYKAECVQRYDDIVARAETADELAEAFAETLATTLVEDAATHRLWYDLRSQALFETSLRADVLEIEGTLERMIWQLVVRYCVLRGVAVALSPAPAYALFDGLFQHCLLRQAAGQDATDDLREGARESLALSAGG